MAFYALIQNNEIIGTGECPCSGEGIACVEILEYTYNNIERYMWDGEEVVPNPDYDAEQLELAKQEKYAEANAKAFEYLESGEAVFTYAEGKSIEATDGNIAKLGLYLVKFLMQEDYTSTIEWNTKENENVQLNAEQLSYITEGLGAIQSEVWTIKFPAYNAAIAAAETIEEVNAIEIDYSAEIEVEE